MKVNIENFRGLKNTKGTYNKILVLAQAILLVQTNGFIESGIMPELTLEERQIISLCNSLSESYKAPKVVRHETIDFYIDLSIKYPSKS